MFLRMAVGLLFLLVSCIFAQTWSVQYRSTERDGLEWQDKGTAHTVLWDNDTANSIEIDVNTTYQTIDGWGGCFNELGWKALLSLTPLARSNVVRELFDPVVGCNFNICRMPIGASDFATNYYSMDDFPGDYSMANFTLARDRKLLIPYIKAAMRYRPDLRVWGSAWTPPAWMKSMLSMSNGKLLQVPKMLDAYALYNSKVVSSLRAEGINFYSLYVENEPANFWGAYPTCYWDGLDIRTFIREYWGPRFDRDGISAQIWLGTINSANYTNYFLSSLQNPGANSYIFGNGIQWAGRDLALRLSQEYPEKKLWETEHMCGNGENDWTYGESTFTWMQQDFENNVNAYMQWNMILDQTSLSHWNWKQCAMITVDTGTKVVTYNPQFYFVKHFSAYVMPGAVRLKTTGPWGTKIAFKNPNGDIVLVFANMSDADYQVPVRISGTQKFKVLAMHRSINTLIFHPLVEAENYSTQSGIQKEACGDIGGGTNVGFIENNDYAVYNNFDFGKGMVEFEARTASLSAGGSIELRLDNTVGTLLGTLTIPVTGGWQTWTNVRTPITPTTGIRNICLVFKGTAGFLFNFNWFKLKPGPWLNMAPAISGLSVSQTNDGSGKVLLRYTGNDFEKDRGYYVVKEFSTNGIAWTPMVTSAADPRLSGMPLNLTTVGTPLCYVWQQWSNVNSYPLIEAEKYWIQSGGLGKEPADQPAETGTNIGWITDGSYTAYTNVDLTYFPNRFECRGASGGSGGTVEVRLDSLTGPIVTTCQIQPTWGWQTWTSFFSDVTNAEGIRNVYLVYRGGAGYSFNLNWVRFFKKQKNGYESTSAKVRIQVTDAFSNSNILTNGPFTLDTLGPRIQLVSPLNGSTGNSGSLSWRWSDLSGVTNFLVEMSSNGFRGIQRFYQTPNGSMTNWTISPPLTPGIIWKWRVRGKDKRNNLGDWSSTWSNISFGFKVSSVVEDCQLNKISSKSVPGSTVICRVSFSNSTAVQNQKALIFFATPDNASFQSNYLGTATSWTSQWSTNVNPNLTWNSVDFVNVRPTNKDKIKWIRWKKETLAGLEGGSLYCQVVVR